MKIDLKLVGLRKPFTKTIKIKINSDKDFCREKKSLILSHTEKECI